MTIVLKLSGFETSDFHVTVSPLAELMSVLHIVAEPDHHLDSRAVLAAVSEHADDSFYREFRFLSPLWARYRCRLFFPFTTHADSLKDELAALDALPLEQFVAYMAEATQGNYGIPAPVERLVADTPERSEYLKYCRSRSTERYDLAVRLLDDPGDIKDRLLAFLADSNERFFKREWEIVQNNIVRSAAVHSHQARQFPGAGSFERLHPSVQYLEQANEVRFDKLQRQNVQLAGRTVIAIPSVRIGSHLTLKWNPEAPVIVQFPLHIADSAQLNIESMRRRLAALYSDTRMELFRHLANEAITTSELATRLGQSAAQISRELRMLRDADFLLSERRGKHIYHRINLEKIVNLGPDLISILLR